MLFKDLQGISISPYKYLNRSGIDIAKGLLRYSEGIEQQPVEVGHSTPYRHNNTNTYQSNQYNLDKDC